MPNCAAMRSNFSRVSARRSSIARTDGLRGNAAARRAERRDLFEEPVLSVGGQIHQQTFGQPRGRRVGIEPGFAQRRRPVLAQVDGDSVALRGRQRAVFSHASGLVLEHLGLVDLEHRGSRGPLQAVGA